MKKTLLMLAVLAAALSAHAGKKTPAANHTNVNIVEAKDFKSELLDDSFYSKLLSDTKSKRTVAQAVVDVPAIENSFSPDFKEMRNDLFNVTKSGDAAANLDAVINKWTAEDKYAQLSHQAQFLALQLRSIKPLKGFIFRASEYVGKHSVMRAAIVSMLRTQISGINAYFPAHNEGSVSLAEAVFLYFTEPQDMMGPAIQTDADFYAYLTQLTSESNKIVTDFSAWVKQGQPVWWDNKLYLAFANFTSEKDRYVKLGTAEQYALYASSCLSLSSLYATTAYSLNGFQDSVKDVGQLFGIDMSTAGGAINALGQLTGSMGASGISSRSRINALKKYPNLFVLTNDGATRMSYSYSALKTAVRAARISWEETKKLSPNDETLFDPRAILPFNRIAGTSFDHVDDLFNGSGVQSTLVAGEVVQVNLAAFYSNPPQRLSDLYPQKFVEGPAVSKKVVAGKQVNFRNYKEGMATAWLVDKYKPYFPDIKSTDGIYTKDIAKYARVVSQTWGLTPFAIPMAAMIF